MVSINEFAAIDLRIGKIIEVADLENARHPMYRLKIDLGELGTKNVVAGIKDAYTKEQLLNSFVVVVANLDSKKVANFTSEGMILAAEDGSNIVLLRPDRELTLGSRVR